MIVISLVLVVASAISLLVGGLFRDDLVLIYVSIGAALAAAVFLGIGVLQGTRKAKPTRAATLPGEDPTGQPATWQGAGWGGAGEEQPVLSRDDDEAEETTKLDQPTPVAPEPVDPAPAPQTAQPPGRGRATSPWAPPPPPPTPPPGAPAQPSGRPRPAPGAAPPPPPPPPA